MSASTRPPAPREALSPARALLDGVGIAFLLGALVAAWIFTMSDGWSYYGTPLAVRGYHPSHRFLRPSGAGGHLIGIAGTCFLFATLLYVARKKLRFLARAGSLPRWLSVHVFCGVFGPILVTFHTSLKFNGLISVAYWSMVLVMLSGFVGRSLYIRIPKTMRGKELTRTELEERARELKARIAESTLPPALATRLAAVERAIEPADHPRTMWERLAAARAVRRSLNDLRREILRSHAGRQVLHDVHAVEKERAMMLRSIDRLERTRKLFQLWHVFHRPLVWVMFLIFFVHLSVAVYFGYTALW